MRVMLVWAILPTSSAHSVQYRRLPHLETILQKWRHDIPQIVGMAVSALFWCLSGVLSRRVIKGNADNLYFVGFIFIQFNLVNHRVKAFIVGAQGL